MQPPHENKNDLSKTREPAETDYSRKYVVRDFRLQLSPDAFPGQGAASPSLLHLSALENAGCSPDYESEPHGEHRLFSGC